MQLTLDRYRQLLRQPRAPRYDGRIVAAWLTGGNASDWPTWLVLVLRPLCDACPADDFAERARRLAHALTLEWDGFADYRLRAAALGIALGHTRQSATLDAVAKTKHLCEQLADPDYPNAEGLEQAQRATRAIAWRAYSTEHDPIAGAAMHACSPEPAALLHTCLSITEAADPRFTDRDARARSWNTLADAMLDALEANPALPFR